MSMNARIKHKFKDMIESGLVKGHIDGPAENVLLCDTLADWVRASGEMVNCGFEVNSPGGYGGSAPESRQLTHYNLWKAGKVCGIQHNENRKPVTLLFGLIREDMSEPYLDIIEDK
jgi:hypothetical protein